MSRFSKQSRPTFFFSVKIFQSRFMFVEILVEIGETNWDCQDFQDLMRLFKIYRDILALSRLFEVLQDQKCWQTERSRSRNVIKLTNSRSRSWQTVEICQKCHVSTDFMVSVKTFGTGRWCWDKIDIDLDRESQSRPHQDKLIPPCLVKWQFWSSEIRPNDPLSNIPSFLYSSNRTSFIWIVEISQVENPACTQ